MAAAPPTRTIANAKENPVNLGDFDPEALARLLRADASRRVVLRSLGGLTALAVAGTPRAGRAAQDATPNASPAASPGATPGATPEATGPYRFTVGEIAVVAVPDGTLAFPSAALPPAPAQFLFADAPPEELAAALRDAGLGEWIDSPGTASAQVSITPLVIDTGDHRVLVDTGLGTGAPLPGGGQLVASLGAAGYPPETIDTVVLSHAHVDHILGAVDAAGAPAFPNARYVMGQTEHAFWTDGARLAEVFPDPAAREGAAGSARAILPLIEAKLGLVDDAAEAEIVPGVRAVAAPGHTPGHMAIAVESGGERLLATFDALSHPLHVEHPEGNSVFDTLPDQTDATRRALLDRAAADGTRLIVYHFPFPGLGRVVRQGDALRWEPAT